MLTRLDLDSVVAKVNVARETIEGFTVGVCGGCFDCLHEGHIYLLSRARMLCDCLVVAINDDESVQALKGRERPASPLADRISALQAQGVGQFVLPFSGPHPGPLLEALRPDLFIKGGDYTDLASLPEWLVCQTYGIAWVTVPRLPNISTSSCLAYLPSVAVTSGWTL